MRHLIIFRIVGRLTLVIQTRVPAEFLDHPRTHMLTGLVVIEYVELLHYPNIAFGKPPQSAVRQRIRYPISCWLFYNLMPRNRIWNKDEQRVIESRQMLMRFSQ